MLSNPETGIAGRPLPPAKARKASLAHAQAQAAAAAAADASTSTASTSASMSIATPPPAYGSTSFTFPSRAGERDIVLERTRKDSVILGSPMATTYRMMGWDTGRDPQAIQTVRAASAHSRQMSAEGDAAGSSSESMGWMSEKSKEELQELLFKADGIIKERENELGLTTAVAKNLYEHNATLKSKHEALLARIPMTPVRPSSELDPLGRASRPNSMSIQYSSSSSSDAGIVKTPLYPPAARARTRKVSIATADISLLADQNAELLDKLQRLEEEATTADHAGRRELKRLEKEILFLREALEKTQAKSEALEEKVQDAVTGEAARRKKEREEKFKAIRSGTKDNAQQQDDAETEIRDFAPGGSTFGGPSGGFSFFPAASSPVRPVPFPTSGLAASDSLGDVAEAYAAPEHALISQLLVKVQELEETNLRILRQQSETAQQLNMVQRDAIHMTRVYDTLADQDTLEIELIDAEAGSSGSSDPDDDKKQVSPQTIRFKSLNKKIAKEVEGTCIVKPELIPSGQKNRKSVMGLFDGADDSWSESADRSAWASSLRGIPLPSPSLSDSLSHLHLFTPAQSQSDLPTLQNELEQQLGSDNFGFPHEPNHHLRTSSLYNLSQYSVSSPASPSPTSRAISRHASEENEAMYMDYEKMRQGSLTPHDMARKASKNNLRLSIEPPTPERASGSKTPTPTSTATVADDYSYAAASRSPRIELISRTLKSRTNRWVERRLKETWQDEERLAPSPSGSRTSKSSSSSGKTYYVGAGNDRVRKRGGKRRAAMALASNAAGMIMPRSISSAVDSMIENFAALSGAADDHHDEDGVIVKGDTDDEGEYYVLNSPAPPLRRSPITPSTGAGSRPSSRSSSPHSRSHTPRPNTPKGKAVQLRPRASAPNVRNAGRSNEVVSNANTSTLFQVWLWFQFAIVVFVFLYSMAKRGPGVVLGAPEDKGKRAVVRRR